VVLAWHTAWDSKTQSGPSRRRDARERSDRQIDEQLEAIKRKVGRR